MPTSHDRWTLDAVVAAYNGSDALPLAWSDGDADRVRRVERIVAVGDGFEVWWTTPDDDPDGAVRGHDRLVRSPDGTLGRDGSELAARSEPQSHLRIEVDPPVATLVIDRDRKRNALTRPMMTGIRRFVEEAATIPDVGAVVLRGDGKGFCAGDDVSGFTHVDLATAEESMVEPLALFAAIETSPKPVVVAIHGFALGGGALIPVAADVTVMHPDAIIGFAEIVHGAVPATLLNRGLDMFSRRLVVELSLTGRALDGRAARACGLAHHVSDDPVSTARRVAVEVASAPEGRAATVKAFLNRHVVDDNARSMEFMPKVLLHTRAH
ncbi:MAG: enoyl-CoA hydratase/isomerase family protein [Acidimicrobiia bacterium]